jgi:hypothetical protein
MPDDRPKLGVVRGRQRFGIILDPDDRRHRPKDFLARDPHLVAHVGEQCRLQIEAGRLAVEALAAEGELGAFILADADIFEILIQLALIDDGADIGTGLHRVIDLQAAHPLGQGLDEFVVNA